MPKSQSSRKSSSSKRPSVKVRRHLVATLQEGEVLNNADFRNASRWMSEGKRMFISMTTVDSVTSSISPTPAVTKTHMWPWNTRIKPNTEDRLDRKNTSRAGRLASTFLQDTDVWEPSYWLDSKGHTEFEKSDNDILNELIGGQQTLQKIELVLLVPPSWNGFRANRYTLNPVKADGGDSDDGGDDDDDLSDNAGSSRSTRSSRKRARTPSPEPVKRSNPRPPRKKVKFLGRKKSASKKTTVAMKAPSKTSRKKTSKKTAGKTVRRVSKKSSKKTSKKSSKKTVKSTLSTRATRSSTTRNRSGLVRGTGQGVRSNELGGRYCPFVNDSKINLSKYQIYTADEKQEDFKHCLQFALEAWISSTPDLSERLKSRLVGVAFKFLKSNEQHLPMKFLPRIARDLDIYINLARLIKDSKKRGTFDEYGDQPLALDNAFYPKLNKRKESKPIMQLGLFMSHFFFNEETSLTRADIRAEHDPDVLNGSKRLGVAEFRNGKKQKVIQVLHKLRMLGFIRKPRSDARVYSEAQSFNNPDGQHTRQQLFEAVECEDESQCRQAVDNSHRAAFMSRIRGTRVYRWVGDVESTFTTSSRDYIRPERVIDKSNFDDRFEDMELYSDSDNYEDGIDRKDGDAKSTFHSLYLIGAAPVSATNPTDVIINENWNGFTKSIVNRYAQEVYEILESYDGKTRTAYDKSGGFKYPLVEVQMYFHNMRYDLSVLQNEHVVFKMLDRGSSKYEATFCLRVPNLDNDGYIENGIWLNIRDSSKHLGIISLSSLPKAYMLPPHLEKKDQGIYYSHFQNDTRNQTTTIDHYLSFRPYNHETQRFTTELSTARCELLKALSDASIPTQQTDNGLSFEPDILYKYYLTYDVLVLAGAMSSYNTNMTRVCSDFLGIKNPIEPISYRTSSALSMGIMKQSGVFSGVHEYSGLLRDYIMLAVRGGRTNPHPDCENTIVQPHGGVADLDAVSLYPSAIAALKYIPTCRPCKLQSDQLDLSIIRIISDAAIVTINLKAIRRKTRYAQPIICVKDPDSGLLDYVQDISKPTTLTLHMIELEDYIKYHDIEYEILYGVYWPVQDIPDPVGYKWSNMMQQLHTARKHAKRLFKETGETSYDVQQRLLKLISNSSYGKTITRVKHVKKRMLAFSTVDDEEKSWLWVYNQWHEIKGRIEFTAKNMIVEQFAPDESFAFVMHGVACLAQSKRHNNLVFAACERAGACVYYCDTDSLFIPRMLLPAIMREYNQLKPPTFPPLEGTELGQFHVDFSTGDFLSFPSDCTADDIYASVLIPVRKKLYLMITEVKSPTSGIVRSITYRGKGLTKLGVIDYCSRNNSSLLSSIPHNVDVRGLTLQQKAIVGFYTSMTGGAVHEVTLNPNSKTTFIYNNRGVRTSVVPMVRKVKARTSEQLG